MITQLHLLVEAKNKYIYITPHAIFGFFISERLQVLDKICFAHKKRFKLESESSLTGGEKKLHHEKRTQQF